MLLLCHQVIEEKLKETTHPHGPAGKTKRGLMALLDLLTDAYNCGEISKEGIREEVDTFMFEVGIFYSQTVCVFILNKMVSEGFDCDE